MEYSVINLKTDPDVKEQALKTAKKLGISLSAVLNNELRRFVTEQSIVIEAPEVINADTAKRLSASRKQVADGNYHTFGNNDEAIEFLEESLR